MGAQSPQIRTFDTKTATHAEYESLNALRNRVKLEATPDDQPTPVDETKAELQDIPSVADISVWVAWNAEGQAVGSGDVGIIHMETNNHLAQFDIRVLPEYRKQGIGSALLQEIAALTERERRRLMMGMTKSTIPAGEAFMQRIGAHVGLATHTNELAVRNLDRGLLRRWQERARERASDSELGLWEGRYPEEELDSIAEVKQSINSMPTDELDINDINWTPDQLRNIDDMIEARGIERWTMYVRETTSRKLAGYTEMMWQASQPKLAEQGDTAVAVAYQNRGLGRWLKAAMLEKLLAERPDVETVRTGNAQSNEPMLNINTELGFRPAMTQLIWQVETQQVLDYLSKRGQKVPAG